MSKFDELLAQLNAEQEAQQDTLAKALQQQDGQDDKKIQAAAGEGEGDGEGESIEGAGEGEGEGEGEESMTKSLTLENGEEAIDATELLKSMQADLAEHGEVLAKGMPQLLTLMQGQNKMIQQQGELIKSLQDRVGELAGQGRGRKAVVTVTEKLAAGETMTKSQSDGITPQEFMLKANTAFDKGIINGVQLTTLDVCLREGKPVDPALIAKIANS
ncbi:hypothetical protein ST4_088 [Aeromonas phage ST4]|nr:hypothetical protein ST4_088 [Aeromonas phage ST4]